MFTLLMLTGCGERQSLEIWHDLVPEGEFSADMLGEEIQSLEDYIDLEDALFDEVDRDIYAHIPTGPAMQLERYSRGSAADPGTRSVNWNRTFEWAVPNPRGTVLLLHGMSDSPYSLRALGEGIREAGYHVLGLRLPGHGTVPAALRTVRWGDMATAVELGLRHLQSLGSGLPLHVVGYSTGGPLALDHTLKALEDPELALPSSLILVSPAIRVHPTGALAAFKDALSVLPGGDNFAYLSAMSEFDPFKYNSFATNAAAQVYQLTRDVGRRIDAALAQDTQRLERMPPILVLKSTVDATVSTRAVVDNLLDRLPGGRNELILFDINRSASLVSTLLVRDPAPLTRRLLARKSLPFAITLVTNAHEDSLAVVARRKAAFSAELSAGEPLGVSWPQSVVSLSHVALTFPPDDPLYGRYPPDNDQELFLGNLAITGERGLLRLPGDWMLRLRYNPFYDFLQQRVLAWLAEASGD